MFLPDVGSRLRPSFSTFHYTGRSSESGGRRHAYRGTGPSGGYHCQDAAILRRRGQAAGLTLAQIRQILQIRDSGTAPCDHVRELLDMRLAEVDEQIAELGRLRATIAQLRTAAENVEPETCQAGAVCAYL